MLRYGSTELALGALNIAYSQLRAQVERHEGYHSAHFPKASALHQRSDVNRQVPGLQLSFAQQAVGIREAAVEQAIGVEKAPALRLLEPESAWARQLARMYPFLVLYRL